MTNQWKGAVGGLSITSFRFRWAYTSSKLRVSDFSNHRPATMDQVMQFVEPSRQFVKDSIRLVKRCTKPDRKEFQKIAMATAIGFAIMGFIGFFVKLIHIPINNIIVNSPSLMRNVTVYSDGFCTVCQDFFFFKDDLPARAACSEVSSSFLFCSFTVLDLTSKAEVPVELNFV
ncbi:hypothetical protein STEG23_012532 [Scotinomys teguina]